MNQAVAFSILIFTTLPVLAVSQEQKEVESSTSTIDAFVSSLASLKALESLLIKDVIQPLVNERKLIQEAMHNEWTIKKKPTIQSVVIHGKDDRWSESSNSMKLMDVAALKMFCKADGQEYKHTLISDFGSAEASKAIISIEYVLGKGKQERTIHTGFVCKLSKNKNNELKWVVSKSTGE